MSIHRDHLPPDWEACTHPEGRLYFFHAAKVFFSVAVSSMLLTRQNFQRIYTDCDVRNPNILIMLEAFSKEIEDRMSEQGLILPA